MRGFEGLGFRGFEGLGQYCCQKVAGGSMSGSCRRCQETTDQKCKELARSSNISPDPVSQGLVFRLSTVDRSRYSITLHPNAFYVLSVT